MHAKSVLLVNDGETQVFVGDGLLKDGVCADQYVDRAIREPGKNTLAHLALFIAGQDRNAKPRLFRQRPNCRISAGAPALPLGP